MPNWTDEQIKAIDTGTNLMVSAAAGSGKTAVLVERIKRKLIPDSEGKYIPVDRLLVVTFARDAAREMQTRLNKVLNEAYLTEKEPAIRKILKEQIKKLVFADICTIDSFCIHFVKQNFHLLGIDPKFKIFDESESAIYKNECLNEYFDILYENKNEDFFLLTDVYSRGYDDREVGELITSVYDFTRSLPDPDFWLETHAEDYAFFGDGLYCAMVEKNFNEAAQIALKGLKNLSKEYKSQVGTDDDEVLKAFGPSDLWSVIQADIQALNKTSFTWDDIFEIRGSFQNVNKSSSKKPEALMQKEFIDKRRIILAPVLEGMNLVKMPSEEEEKLYKNKLYPVARAISRLTQGFGEYVFTKKTKDGKFDFNDLEHMALKLLRENVDVRNQLTLKYYEILMDEYQDTNALQEEIFTLISNGKNRFMVGDMKQSIYRFRSSDPFIFRHKNELYAKDPSAGNRVVLSKNFRSRPEVLSSINCVFEKIMTYKVGEVDYNEEQALHFGNPDFNTRYPQNDYTSEFHLIEGESRGADDDELMSDRELEAAFVAEKIRDMIDSGWKVFDGGKFRNAEAGDFAILMNSVKSDSSIFIDALRKKGLNGYSEDKEFLEKTEIKLVLSFISVVNNPYNDISLVSVMRSPVYRFTDEELACIRLSAVGEFWKCTVEKAKENSPLGEKCKSFCDAVNKWRELSRFMSAERLVWRIMTESSLYDMCGILYGGDTALANLKLFTERTRVMSENGIVTLNDLEIYMSNLKGTDGLSSASTGFNGVPVMTIHKSKGLEFPVVFVCGLGKKIRSEGNSGIVNLHKDLGFGLNDINSKENYSLTTVNRSAIATVKNRESISEQLRKLYVGLTRAKEKLIVTAVVGEKKDGATFDFTDVNVNEENIEKASSFAKIMAPVVKQFGGKHWFYKEYQKGTLVFDDEVITAAETVAEEKGVAEDVDLAFKRFLELSDLPAVSTKISVSEFKNKEGFSSKLQQFPAYMNKGGGAAFGTAVHGIMEEIELMSSMGLDHIRDEVFRILGENDSLVEEKILAFFTSELGNRALASGRVMREAEFETNIPAFDLAGNIVSDQTMLLQGVIDLYFEEEDGYVLVDYKTDKCDELTELVDKYGVQLKWYKYAMDKLLHKKVKNVYIYSFHKNTFIEILELM